MSKAEVKKEKEQPKKADKIDHVTIGEYFSEYLENKSCRIVNFMPIEKWSANPKQNKYARVKIQLPKEICNLSTKDLRNWFLSIVAIPRELIHPKEKSERDEKNNGKKN